MKKQVSCSCFVTIFLCITFVALCFFTFFTFNSLKNEYIYGRLIKLNISIPTTQFHINGVSITNFVNFSSSSSSSLSPSNNVVLKDIDDEDEEDDEEEQHLTKQDSLPSLNDTLNPPEEFHLDQRLAWFKEKLPRIRILHSTRKSQRFNDRVLKFFEGQKTNQSQCSTKIFMTWIAPASLFGKRYLISLETIFKSHPNGCVVIASPSLDSRNGSKIFEPFHSRDFRVKPITPDLAYLSKGTPAEPWLTSLKNGAVDPGKIPITQNLSNLLRLLLIYKYGGTYLDTDFIILKDMSKLRNSVGIQIMDNVHKRDWKELNNAMLTFDKEHPLVFKFIQDFVNRFNGSLWGHNGPYMVTRVVKNETKVEHKFELNVLEQMAFYPVDWNDIVKLFKKPESDDDKKFVEDWLVELDKKCYGIHLWNKISRNLKIEREGIMGRLISSHCVICQDIFDDDEDHDDNDHKSKIS